MAINLIAEKEVKDIKDCAFYQTMEMVSWWISIYRCIH